MVLITIVTQGRHQTPGSALCPMVTPAQAEQVKWVQLAQLVFAIRFLFLQHDEMKTEKLQNNKQPNI